MSVASRSPRFLKPLLAVLVCACLGWRAFAGGSGLNTIVVVNQSSSNSVALGNLYCERRGVPPLNVFRMTGWTGGRIDWGLADFETQLRQPLLQMLAERGLAAQAEFVVLSMDIPYRVSTLDTRNSTTSALYYGFKTNTPLEDATLPLSCSLPNASSNTYALSELPFRDARPGTNSLLAMMLTASSLEQAEMILSRGVAADSSFPTQQVLLERTDDPFRNVRYLEFANVNFESRILGQNSFLITNSSSVAFADLRGMQTGVWDAALPANAFLPGAIGDTLTSFSGQIFEASGQISALAFLAAGAAGSYGTVDEPCNYLEKFPDPFAFFYQERGFSLAESYYMSVRNPYQGLMVGEPLCAPFARPGGAQMQGLSDGAILSGPVPIQMTFTAAESNRPMAQVDLFMDGLYLRTLTNVTPQAGNTLSVTLNQVKVNPVIPAGSTLASATLLLADSLNAVTNRTRVAAQVLGDRIVLRSLEQKRLGGEIDLNATTTADTAGAQTISLWPSRQAFLDTVASGLLGLSVSNTPAVGDWLQLEVLKTNGTLVSVAVTNTASDGTIGTLGRSLFDAVSNNPELQGPDGVLPEDFVHDPDRHVIYFTLEARSAGWAAAEANVTLSGSSSLKIRPSGNNKLEDNLSDLQPRNHLNLDCGLPVLNVVFALDTLQFADGWHELAAVAYEGTSVRTQTRISRNVQIQNTDWTVGLSPVGGGFVAALGSPLKLQVTSSAEGPFRAELFSTGGSVAVVSNAIPGSEFSISTSFLGAGLHPFWAVLTDANGRQYRTATSRIQITSVPVLAIGGYPLKLQWVAVPGKTYDILAGTDIGNWSVAASITATSSVENWLIPQTNGVATFYRLRTAP